MRDPQPGPVDGDMMDAMRRAFDAGYRRGYRNGQADAAEGEEEFGDVPGDAFDLWLDDGGSDA